MLRVFQKDITDSRNFIIILEIFFCAYSGGVLPRATILAEWLRHFNDLEVGETAAPACFFAGERGGGRNAPAAKSLK